MASARFGMPSAGPRASCFLRLALLPCLFLTGCATFGIPSPLATLEQSVVYQPTPPDSHGDRERLRDGFEEAWFTAGDGVRLHGWFAAHENPRAVALFAHGNAGNVSSWGTTLRELRDRHELAVLVFDYRGYGRSAGTPSEEGLLQDARAARRWLAERTDVAEKDILLIGRSLGGGVVVRLAAEDGAAGLVLQSTFTSLPDVGSAHVPWLLPKLTMRNRFDSLSRIDEYHGPLLVSHGDADEVIPYAQGRRLFGAANEPKWFVTIPHGRHNDSPGEDYARRFDAFVESLSPPHAR